VLASTAVLGIIIGFAGRQVIANLVGGVLMTFTQPIRIGDLVKIGEEVEGRVVDIALTYTKIDSGDGRLTVVPNEKVTTEEGGDRAKREADLREHAQRALREAGQLRQL
jgi:small-conductance mechanosensitive channel